ncbi:hypothetical protein RB601_002514 [Gaeumannomyces tritici]
MSDPLSLAAAGAGFVSLGLTVCDGIYKYINACAGKSADLHQLRETADDLKSVVELIEARLAQATSQTSTSAASTATKTAIKGRITSCEAAATCILELAEKHAPALAGARLADRIKRLARAGTYPMRRESLMELQQACQRYKNSLVLLLQLFQVDGISELRDTLAAKMDAVNIATSSSLSGLEQRFLTATSTQATRVVQDTRDTVIQSQDALVQNINAASSRTDASIISAGQSNVAAIIEAGAGQSQRTQEVILQRLDSVEARALSFQHHHSEALIEAIENRLSQKLQAAFASRQPFQDLYVASPVTAIAATQGSDSHTTDQRGSLLALPNGSTHAASGFRRRPTRERRPRLADGISPGSVQAVERGCTCTAQVQVQVSQPRRYFGSLWLQSEESVVHHRDCPLWYLSRRRRTFRVNFSAFGFAVYGPIEVENSPFYWLKQLHIDPKLSFTSVVPFGSPAFQMVKNFLIQPRSRYAELADDPVRQLERQLLELFQRGEASPTDVDPDGKNLLHELCLVLIRHCLFYCFHRGGEVEAVQLRALAPVLFKMGVPRCQTNNNGRPPLGQILTIRACHTNSMPVETICDHMPPLLDLVYISLISGPALGVADFVELFHISNALGDPKTWCRGEIGIVLQTRFEWCTQITSSDRPLTIACAKGDVDRVRSILDSSPEFLATEKNDLDQTPLHLAVLRPAILALLLACSTYTGSIIDHKDCSGHSAMYYALKTKDPKVLLMLSKSGASLGPAMELLDSRVFSGPKVYAWFAKACRARLEELVRLGIANGCASNTQLAQFPHPLEVFNTIAWALREKGVRIPISISSAIPRKPFGHLRQLNVSMAESLWDNGLLKLDEGYNGVFPILRQVPPRARRKLYLQDWLWSKNPRLDFPTGIDCLQAVHILAAGCANKRYSPKKPSQLRCTSWSHPPPARFSCFCIGSASIFIPFRRFGQEGTHLSAILEACRLDGLLEEHSSDVLRALTFGALDLTHTCPLLSNPYYWDYWGEKDFYELPVIEAVEIERIHDEEEEPITRFESLLGELAWEHQQRPMPFPEFLAVVWLPRIMDEVVQCDPRTKRYLDEVMEWIEGYQMDHMPELPLERIREWLMCDGEGDD